MIELNDPDSGSFKGVLFQMDVKSTLALLTETPKMMSLSVLYQSRALNSKMSSKTMGFFAQSTFYTSIDS